MFWYDVKFAFTLDASGVGVCRLHILQSRQK